jgi:hypothetical protein
MSMNQKCFTPEEKNVEQPPPAVPVKSRRGRLLHISGKFFTIKPAIGMASLTLHENYLLDGILVLIARQKFCRIFRFCSRRSGLELWLDNVRHEMRQKL